MGKVERKAWILRCYKRWDKEELKFRAAVPIISTSGVHMNSFTEVCWQAVL